MLSLGIDNAVCNDDQYYDNILNIFTLFVLKYSIGSIAGIYVNFLIASSWMGPVIASESWSHWIWDLDWIFLP